jgi:hypoxanthine phosphoribosyltransferase
LQNLKRRRLLQYLLKKDADRYKSVIEKLGLARLFSCPKFFRGIYGTQVPFFVFMAQPVESLARNEVIIGQFPLLSQKNEFAEKPEDLYHEVGTLGLRVVRFAVPGEDGQLAVNEYIAPFFSQLVESAHHVANNIKLSKVRVGAIGTANNGGATVAKLVQDGLGLFKMKVVAIGLEGYEGTERLDVLKVTHGLPEGWSCEGNTVFVDDIDDSGRAMKTGSEMFGEKTSGRVYTAAIYRRNRSNFQPDFPGVLIPDDAWVRFPTDICESEATFRENWTNQGVPTDVQNLRMRIMNSEDLHEQLQIAERLNILAGIRNSAPRRPTTLG